MLPLPFSLMVGTEEDSQEDLWLRGFQGADHSLSFNHIIVHAILLILNIFLIYNRFHFILVNGETPFLTLGFSFAYLVDLGFG